MTLLYRAVGHLALINFKSQFTYYTNFLSRRITGTKAVAATPPPPSAPSPKAHPSPVSPPWRCRRPRWQERASPRWPDSKVARQSPIWPGRAARSCRERPLSKRIPGNNLKSVSWFGDGLSFRDWFLLLDKGLLFNVVILDYNGFSVEAQNGDSWSCRISLWTFYHL